MAQSPKSMVQIAFELMSKRKRSVAFDRIYKEICDTLKLSEEEAKRYIAQFYTQLTLDGRFICTSDNMWDLKTRRKSEELVVDLDEFVDEEEDLDDEDRIKELGEEDDDSLEKSSHDDDYVRSPKTKEVEGFHIVDDTDEN